MADRRKVELPRGAAQPQGWPQGPAARARLFRWLLRRLRAAGTFAGRALCRLASELASRLGHCALTGDGPYIIARARRRFPQSLLIRYSSRYVTVSRLCVFSFAGPDEECSAFLVDYVRQIITA